MDYSVIQNEMPTLSPYKKRRLIAQNSSVNGEGQMAPPINQKAWKGNYNIEMKIDSSIKDQKSTSLTYSTKLNKIYVRMDSPCPLIIRLQRPVNENKKLFVRFMCCYARAEHAQTPVIRCPTHSQNDNLTQTSNRSSKIVSYGNHLLRCDNRSAKYEENSIDGRHSVIVPISRNNSNEFNENNQNSSMTIDTSFILRFMCYSSCVGSLNRRPINLLMILEDNERNIFGRCVTSVRVCACPGRDRRNEEAQENLGKNDEFYDRKFAEKNHIQHATINTELNRIFPDVLEKVNEEKRNSNGNSDEIFILRIRSRTIYETLKKIRDALEFDAFHRGQIANLSRLTSLPLTNIAPINEDNERNDDQYEHSAQHPNQDHLTTTIDINGQRRHPSVGYSGIITQHNGYPSIRPLRKEHYLEDDESDGHRKRSEMKGNCDNKHKLIKTTNSINKNDIINNHYNNNNNDIHTNKFDKRPDLLFLEETETRSTIQQNDVVTNESTYQIIQRANTPPLHQIENWPDDFNFGMTTDDYFLDKQPSNRFSLMRSSKLKSINRLSQLFDRNSAEYLNAFHF
ncbi:hypothetical protein SNEBB_009957 [Seison nebaliae]|nr:hypothetical protein SNEBB_009957 [Seison nebaliae]